MKNKISIKTINTHVGPRDFIFVDGISSGIYAPPANFPALRKFARDYRDDVIAHTLSDDRGNTGFIFYMCGYSGPAQNAFRDAHPEIWV